MTENANQNPFASFETHDPVRALVCEDCCRQVTGYRNNLLEDTRESLYIILQSMILPVKIITESIYVIAILVTSIFSHEHPYDADHGPHRNGKQDAHGSERAKQIELAHTIDQRAHLTLSTYSDLGIHDRESAAHAHHLGQLLGEIHDAFGNPDVDAGALDCELRKLRSAQINLHEDRRQKEQLATVRHIDRVRSELADLNHYWRGARNHEENAARLGDEVAARHFQRERIAMDIDMKNGEAHLKDLQSHLAAIT